MKVVAGESRDANNRPTDLKEAEDVKREGKPSNVTVPKEADWNDVETNNLGVFDRGELDTILTLRFSDLENQRELVGQSTPEIQI